MKVKELIKLLKTLNPEAVIDLSVDEEGNCYGDISPDIAEGVLSKTGEQVFSLYPENCEDPMERYSQ